MRAAADTDAGSLARCHVACWREAYAHLLSPAFLDSQDVQAREAMWRRVLESRPPVSVAVVDDDDVVGFAGAGSGRDDDPALPRLELRVLYLRAAFHGSGAGQELLDAVLGDAPASLWVAEDNPRAHAFYRRNGFRLDGARAVRDEWEGLVEVRMVRPGSEISTAL